MEGSSVSRSDSRPERSDRVSGFIGAVASLSGSGGVSRFVIMTHIKGCHGLFGARLGPGGNFSWRYRVMSLRRWSVVFWPSLIACERLGYAIMVNGLSWRIN